MDVNKSDMPKDPFAEIWSNVCGLIRNRVSGDTFERWFSAVRMISADEENLVLEVPNQIYQFWIETNYNDVLLGAVADVLKGPRKITYRYAETDETASFDDEDFEEEELELEDDDEEVALPNQEKEKVPEVRAAARGSRLSEAKQVIAPPVGGASVKTTSKSKKSFPDKLMASGLSQKYSFDTFVVGANNQFAHAASMAVAESPATTYNPLFIYGGVGLGKTHLMHAIGQAVLESRPKAKVLYVTSEKFTNEFIDAIGTGGTAKFRKFYRQADVLLIDDVQFFANKDSTQEEFFHTFNCLSDGCKQIVLTSDRPPSEISNLEKRLVSRFEWGLTAELQAPDIETRVAILRKKMEEWRVTVDPEIVDYLADRIHRNVRRLEGGLMRVASFASLSDKEITIATVEDLLKDILQEEARKVVTIDQIQRTVAEHFDVRVADMTSRRRPANIAFARQVAMYFSREMTGASFKEVGDAFGGRDHGTVMHACKLIKSRIEENEEVRQTVTLLETKLRR